jgi:hypothetical protein
MLHSRFLASATAAAALGVFAASAQAATYNLDLLGDPATGTPFTQDAYGLHYDRVSYNLSGFDPENLITVVQGDSIHATVQFQDDMMAPVSLVVPGAELQSQFLLYLSGVFAAATTGTSGSMTFYNGGDVVATLATDGPTFGQLANRSVLPGATPIAFDSLIADFTITELSGSADLTSASFGTVLISSGAPEPSAWALMLLGFGGLGGALRARRRRDGRAAVRT